MSVSRELIRFRLFSIRGRIWAVVFSYWCSDRYALSIFALFSQYCPFSYQARMILMRMPLYGVYTALAVPSENVSRHNAGPAEAWESAATDPASAIPQSTSSTLTPLGGVVVRAKGGPRVTVCVLHAMFAMGNPTHSSSHSPPAFQDRFLNSVYLLPSKYAHIMAATRPHALSNVACRGRRGRGRGWRWRTRRHTTPSIRYAYLQRGHSCTLKRLWWRCLAGLRTSPVISWVEKVLIIN